MRFRLKIFLVAIVLSLAPLAAVTLSGQYILRTSGERLARTVGAHVERIVGTELLQTVVQHVQGMAEGEAMVEYALADMVRTAEAFLATPPPTHDSGKTPRLYSAQDFSSPRTAPPDATEQDVPQRMDTGMGMGMMRRMHPLLLSPSTPAFSMPNAPPVTTPQARQLARLTPLLKHITTGFDGLIFKAHITLKSGLHMVFPGQGGLPPRFDGRNRPYYAVTHSGAETVWTGPYVDTNTQRVIYTASRTLLGPDEAPAGVAALDIALPDLLRESDITAQWSDKAQVFMVTLEQNPTTQKPGLRIYAQRDMLRSTPKMGMHWRGLLRQRWLTPDTTASRAALVRRMQAEDTGIVRLPRDGRDTLWAFARMHGTRHYHVITVPRSVVEHLPQQARQAVHTSTRQQYTAVAATAGVVVALMLLLTGIGARVLTRPIMALADMARRLGQGDFSARLDLRLGDERDILIDVMNSIGPRLKDHLRQKQALSIAREVHSRLLPSTCPLFPGWDISGSSTTCEEAGGDYYDYFDPDGTGTRYTIAIGDVTGHGIGAALLMATVRAQLRLPCPDNGDPAVRVARVNTQLARDVHGSGNFMTLLLMEIDAHTGALTWVRAGHDPILVLPPDTDNFEEMAGTGLPIGITESADYVAEHLPPPAPGTLFILGTDGIWETRNPAGDMFGKGRLQRTVAAHRHRNVDDIRQAILDATAAFSGGAPQEDDITLIVLRYTGTEHDENAPKEPQ